MAEQVKIMNMRMILTNTMNLLHLKDTNILNYFKLLQGSNVTLHVKY